MNPITEERNSLFRKSIILGTFGDDIGDSLNQLKFEFDELEHNKIPEGYIPTTETIKEHDNVNVEQPADHEIQNAPEEIHSEDSERLKKHSYSISNVVDSLKNVRKRLHIKKHKSTKHKTGAHDNVTSSDNSESEDSNKSPKSTLNRDNNSKDAKHEQNNNIPNINIQNENHSDNVSGFLTVPRKPKSSKKVLRSHTMSPQKPVPDGLSIVKREEAEKSTTPPVVIDGALVYDYQYSRPSPRLSPAVESEKNKSRNKVARNQSMSKLLRLVKSPQKSLNSGSKNATPLKELYNKTVMSQSVPYNMNTVGETSPKSAKTAQIAQESGRRHNSSSTVEKFPRLFPNSEYNYSTLPLPRKQKV